MDIEYSILGCDASINRCFQLSNYNNGKKQGNYGGF